MRLYCQKYKSTCDSVVWSLSKWAYCTFLVHFMYSPFSWAPCSKSLASWGIFTYIHCIHSTSTVAVSTSLVPSCLLSIVIVGVGRWLSRDDCTNQRHSHDRTAALKRRQPGAFLVQQHTQHTALCSGSIKMNDDQILRWRKNHPPCLKVWVKRVFKMSFSLLFEFTKL